MAAARGKYIAFCEGDDYWIDNYKLMKQYEFLENNPAFSAVVSDVKCIDENGTLINGFAPYKRKESGIFTLEDYHRLENPGMGVTMLCRNPLLMGADWDIRYKADYMMGDMSFRAVLLAYGDIYQMKEATAVYRHVRRNGGGSFNSINLKNNWMPLRYVRYWIRIENYLKEQTKTDYRIEIIDEQIQPLSRQFKWKDLYIALKETKDKSRVRAAFLYHFVAVNGRRYTGEKCTYKTGGWHNFIRVRKPIVVFGAGDLATEFLNIYAWQMPVKFLVDNDCNKIGKSMKGYLVKEPREILHFMDEVVVLVANEKYEKDIINQLEGMGIHNYYCYYSMQRKRLRNRIVCKLVMET